MLFIFDFKDLKKVLPLFLSLLFIAIIDIFHMVLKTFWTIVAIGFTLLRVPGLLLLMLTFQPIKNKSLWLCFLFLIKRQNIQSVSIADNALRV
jgi:hypothetical protein